MSDDRSATVDLRRLLPVATVVAVVVFWELTSHLGLYNTKLLPPPSQIIQAFVRMVRTGLWLNDVEATLSRYAAGFIIGAISGVLVGVATGRLEDSLFRDRSLDEFSAKHTLRCAGAAVDRPAGDRRGWESFRHSMGGFLPGVDCHPLRGAQRHSRLRVGSPQSGCASNAAFDRGHFSPGSTVYRVGDTDRRRHRFFCACRGRNGWRVCRSSFSDILRTTRFPHGRNDGRNLDNRRPWICRRSCFCHVNETGDPMVA